MIKLDVVENLLETDKVRSCQSLSQQTELGAIRRRSWNLKLVRWAMLVHKSPMLDSIRLTLESATRAAKGATRCSDTDSTKSTKDVSSREGVEQ